jgi:hypothetical protein
MLCYWCDDGQDDPDADVVRYGPNGSLSLTAARRLFHETLTALPPESSLCARERSLREDKQRVVELFDRMTGAIDGAEFLRLLRAVRVAMSALSKKRGPVRRRGASEPA